MPLVKISVRRGMNREDKMKLHDAVHNALVTSLEIPDWDFFHRIHEFSEEDFIFPEMKSDKFIILEVYLFPGRSSETKKRMYKALCDNLEDGGIPRSDIFIQVFEPPLENWGIQGGIPASEAGLKIKE